MVIRSLERDTADTPQRRRLLGLVCGVTLWSLLLITRLVNLQVQQHEQLVARAHDQQTDVITLPAKRGDILSREGRVLATSIELGSIYAHPNRIGDRERVAELLAPALDLSATEVLGLLNPDKTFVYLRRKAHPDTLAEVTRIVRRHDLASLVWFHEEARRYYPHRSLAAHVLGWVDIDNAGQTGVERYYDRQIRGRDGKLNTLKDATTGVVGGNELALENPTRGQDLRLTLDRRLQYAAEEALERAVTSHDAAGGSVVALDPHTGELLALASYPTFNPNRFDEAMVRHATNHAVQSAFEPGSVFKVITAAAAIHEGVVHEDEPIDCEGGRYRVANHTYRDWRFGFGVMAFRDVLANSSNVGTIKVCRRMQPETYFAWLRDFGFGAPTGVDLPGEATGLLRPPERWSKLTQSSMAFGQEISSTPIQLASALAAVANGGLLVRPHVLSELRDSGGGVVRAHEPEVRNRVLKDSVARRVAGIMEHVVRTGTGSRAAIDGYRIAGKTSTAEKFDPETGTYGKYVAGFAGFLPVSDPQVVILVMIDEPDPDRPHGGSVVALPVFREIAVAAIRSMRIAPDGRGPVPNWITGQEPEASVTPTAGVPPLP